MTAAAAAADERGQVAVEVALLAPVLLLFAATVLWAGSSGRAELATHLAATEGAAAAALCCLDAPGRSAAAERTVLDKHELGNLCVEVDVDVSTIGSPPTAVLVAVTCHHVGVFGGLGFGALSNTYRSFGWATIPRWRAHG